MLVRHPRRVVAKACSPWELQVREILSHLPKGQFDSAERRSRIMISRFPEGLDSLIRRLPPRVYTPDLPGPPPRPLLA